MAKTDINHIDGYTQGTSTLCKYQPGDLVPGLNVGGWHDAGDYDLRVESQAGEAYILAMACENFGTYWDETSIDFEKKIVEIHDSGGGEGSGASLQRDSVSYRTPVCTLG